MTPLRNVSVTDSCPVCGEPLPLGRPRKTCSDGCRQALWRKRNHSTIEHSEVSVTQPGKVRTVYECPACDIRLLGEQRCECGSFMRKVGLGGLCPCCGEPVTVEELLAT